MKDDTNSMECPLPLHTLDVEDRSLIYTTGCSQLDQAVVSTNIKPMTDEGFSTFASFPRDGDGFSTFASVPSDGDSFLSPERLDFIKTHLGKLIDEVEAVKKNIEMERKDAIEQNGRTVITNDILKKEVERLNVELHKSKIKFEGALNVQNDEANRLKEKIHKLKGENSRLEDNVTKQKVKIREQTIEISNLKKKITNVESRDGNEKRSEVIKELKAKIREQKIEISNWKKRIMNNEHLLDEVLYKNSMLTSISNVKLCDVNEKLSEVIKEKETNIVCLKKKLQRSRSFNDGLTCGHVDHLDKLLEERRELENDLLKLEAKEEALEQEIKKC